MTEVDTRRCLGSPWPPELWSIVGVHGDCSGMARWCPRGSPWRMWLSDERKQSSGIYCFYLPPELRLRVSEDEDERSAKEIEIEIGLASIFKKAKPFSVSFPDVFLIHGLINGPWIPCDLQVTSLVMQRTEWISEMKWLGVVLYLRWGSVTFPTAPYGNPEA